MKQNKKRSHIKIGNLDVPKDYNDYDPELKNIVCDNLLDELYKEIDKHLLPEFDRIKFLKEVLESSLMINEEKEFYEVCTVIRDCHRRLNED